MTACDCGHDCCATDASPPDFTKRTWYRWETVPVVDGVATLPDGRVVRTLPGAREVTLPVLVEAPA